MLSEINSFKAIINIDFFFSNVLPLTYATAHDLLPSCQDYCEEGLGFFMAVLNTCSKNQCAQTQYGTSSIQFTLALSAKFTSVGF